MSLFDSDSVDSVCNGGGSGGGGETSGNGDTGVSGTISSIIIVDDGGGEEPWDGGVVVTNIGDFPSGGVANTVSLSGNGTGGGGVSSVSVSALGDLVGIVVFNANESAGGGGSTTVPNPIGVSGYNSNDIKITMDGEAMGVSSFPGNAKTGVSGYDTADVKVTLDGEIVSVLVGNFPASPSNQNVTVTTTSSLQTSSMILSGASDAPQYSIVFMDAPGTGFQIVLYGITGWVAGTATSLAGQLYLHKGDFASGALVHAAINISQTYQNFSWDTFHGVAIGENTALKFTLLEGSTNATACIIARYKIEAV